jgi:hypothetical protein
LKLIILPILLLLFCSHWAYSQKKLVLERVGKGQHIAYEAGDEIRYQLTFEDHFRKGIIASLGDNEIQFQHFSIHTDSIAAVDIRGRRFNKLNTYSLGAKLQFAGVGYILIDQFNTAVVQGNEFSLNTGVLVAGGSIFAAGTLLRILHKKKFKPGGRNKMYIADYSPK